MKNFRNTSIHAALLAALLLAAAPLLAEQSRRIGDYEVHYVVVQSTFFNEDIARRYQIVRGRDRSVLNLSVLDAGGRPTAVSLRGTATNLLGQVSELDFREIREAPAVYYLAQMRYTNRETVRFRLFITTPDGSEHELSFQQEMFWDGR